MLIARLFHVRYTERGVSYLLHRIGWTPQVPVQFVDDQDWLTVVQLPALRCGIDRLAAIVRTRLKCIQYRPALIDAFIAETGLVIQPQPP